MLILFIFRHNGAKNEHFGINIIAYSTEQPYKQTFKIIYEQKYSHK